MQGTSFISCHLKTMEDDRDQLPVFQGRTLKFDIEVMSNIEEDLGIGRVCPFVLHSRYFWMSSVHRGQIESSIKMNIPLLIPAYSLA